MVPGMLYAGHENGPPDQNILGSGGFFDVRAPVLVCPGVGSLCSVANNDAL